MKRTTLLFVLAILLSVPNLSAQKKSPREQSGKALRQQLIQLHKYRNVIKDKKKPACNIRALYNSVKLGDLVPSEKEATVIVNSVMDSLAIRPEYGQIFGLNNAMNSEKYPDFVKKQTGMDLGTLDAGSNKLYRKFYFRIRDLKTKGFKVYEKTINRAECKIKLEITLKLTSVTMGYKKNKKNALTANWDISSLLVFDCNCNAKNKHRVKYASFRFSASTKGPIVFPRTINRGGKDVKVGQFGFRFEKLSKIIGRRTQLNCCTADDDSEDGSFVDPDEPIRYDSPFINTGIGLGFVNDSDTQITGNAGVLFPVTSIGNNPLFIGGQFAINSSSISADFVTNEYRVGPITEYDVAVNDRGLEWVVGLFTGYIFGSTDLGEFDQDFDGFFANLYTGLDIPISESITIPVILSFMEYQSLNLTIDEIGEEGSFDSGISFDRIGLSTGVRINIGN